MTSNNAYLLIASPSENTQGERVSALDLAERRLSAKKWGLWAHTPHQKEIQTGDLCIIYLAGTGAKQFVACARVVNVLRSTTMNHIDGDALTDFPSTVLHLNDVQWFKHPISIANIKDKLDFIPKNVVRWGCVLQRGVKKISPKDASTILKSETH